MRSCAHMPNNSEWKYEQKFPSNKRNVIGLYIAPLPVSNKRVSGAVAFHFFSQKKKIRKKGKKTQKHSIKQNSHKIKYYCLLFYLVPRVILWPIKRWIKSELNTHKKSFFPNSNNKGLHITVRKNEHKIYVTKAKENL